ncbi:hypothetical protein QA633_43640 [Bradyrhizobium barranii]|uniref:hypothetical protein n=1 Tax=Bradyrhizobium TaxID=374 RepID=UPI0024AF50E9|nr:hypothetical protein [Bradyrhizobium barranii]WFT95067.1 hypothetical protein QA633_43640 [Bradyrhizobium barranii]
MALTGVHITFGYSIADAGDRPSGTALPFSATASDTMVAAGTSTKTAPQANPGQRPMLSITATLAIFYATGPNPDPVAGPRRYYDPAFGTNDIFVNAGDKFAWVAA